MLDILEFFEDVKKHLKERDGENFSGFGETLNKIREERVTEYVEFSFVLCRERHSHPFLLSFSRNLMLFVTVRVG